MSTVDERLRSGLNLIARAGTDRELLGAAVVTLHAAAAAYLDETLAALPELDVFDAEFLASGGVEWVSRANLALKYGLVNREQRAALLDADRQARLVARGEPFRGNPHTARAYGQFVATLCRRHTFLASAERPDSLLTPEDALRPPRAAESWLERVRRRRGTRAEDSGARIAVGTALVAIVASLLLIAALWLWQPWERAAGPQPTAVVGVALVAPQPSQVAVPTLAAAPNQAALSPTIAAPPTSAQQSQPTRARVVHLGGAVGYLHVAPEFSSPRLDVALHDGAELELLSPTPVKADGALWYHVRIAEFSGWCPSINLELR
ncbi:MAG: hypothetical protein RLZZ387_4887 [Chloroflexota bacterium]